jgi:anti-sigma28 factor (negative regulator of flagellin synthesis)
MTVSMDFQAMFTAKQNKCKGTSKCSGNSKAPASLAGSLIQLRMPGVDIVRNTLQAGEARERNERLALLRREIAAGTYFVSSRDVAERLMQSMLKN